MTNNYLSPFWNCKSRKCCLLLNVTHLGSIILEDGLHLTCKNVFLIKNWILHQKTKLAFFCVFNCWTNANISLSSKSYLIGKILIYLPRDNKKFVFSEAFSGIPWRRQGQKVERPCWTLNKTNYQLFRSGDQTWPSGKTLHRVDSSVNS